MLKLLARRKTSRRQRRRLFVYWFIALVLIIAFFANIIKFFSTSFSFLNTPKGTKLTFEKFEGEKITGVILSDPLFLATFDPEAGKVDVFELPKNLYFDLGSKGFYLAAKVHQLEPGDSGVRLLASALEANFKIPVDFYLDFGSQIVNEEKISELREKIGKADSLWWFFQIPKSSRFLKTNFTLIDQFKLLWELRKVRGDKFNFEKVSAENFEEVVLPNEDKAAVIAKDGLLPEFVNLFQDLQVAQEGLTVGVYNASGKAGLAQTVAEICQTLGIHAVVGGESDKPETTTKILAKDHRMSSLTLKRLVKTFGGKVEKQPNGDLEDVVVLVGADLGDQLVF